MSLDIYPSYLTLGSSQTAWILQVVEIYLHVIHLTRDYLQPILVSFFTNTGGHNPSYMCLFIADYYSMDDFFMKRRPVTGS